MPFTKFVSCLLRSMALLVLLLGAPAGWANEKAGGGAGGYTKIEPFTVNLVGGAQYLQVSISIKGATPEFGVTVAERMPFVRHELILLLSSQHSEEITTVEGKKLLLEHLKEAINKAIKLSGHEGVTEVLFETFIVQ